MTVILLVSLLSSIHTYKVPSQKTRTASAFCQEATACHLVSQPRHISRCRLVVSVISRRRDRNIHQGKRTTLSLPNRVPVGRQCAIGSMLRGGHIPSPDRPHLSSRVYTGDPLYVGVCIHGAKKENDGLRPTNVPVLNAFPLPHGFYRYLSVR